MPQMRRRKLPYAEILGATLTLAACLLLLWDPENAIAGGLQGLRIFGEIVLPSLLPFFVVSEVLIGLGLVHFLGALVEPLMRPLFNVPGTGSFVWSMGLAAGYPMDAVITAKLRLSGNCTQIEGERLLAFTNTADPLFLLGAVAVGMFGLPALGFHLALAHYLSAIAVGLIFRFYGLQKGEPQKTVAASQPKVSHRRGYWQRAILELKQARRQDGRALGRLLADAMTESTTTLMKICGFIMFFASLIRLMESTQLLQLMGLPVGGILSTLGWRSELTPGLVAGVLELDVGAAMTAEVMAPLAQRLAVVSAIVAWSGLSVHGQVASIVCRTDLRLGAYMKARLLHALLAAVIALGLLYIRPISLSAASSPMTTLAFSPLFRLKLAGGLIAVCIAGGSLVHWYNGRKWL